jgi:enhancing lycopene biosynthesis protein 2
MKKFALVLSGCGVYDGSEIQEAVLAMLAIDKSGGCVEIFAPDVFQHHVVNHRTSQEMDGHRNVLTESARIARGKIKSLHELNPENFDGLVLPGGFGAAKNLSDYAFMGEKMKVIPDLEKVLRAMHNLKKPIGAMCISPVILACVFGNVELTIGHDEQTAFHITQMGAHHKQTRATEIVVDVEHKLVTTPCYMINSGIAQIAAGADAMIAAMLKLM